MIETTRVGKYSDAISSAMMKRPPRGLQVDQRIAGSTAQTTVITTVAAVT